MAKLNAFNNKVYVTKSIYSHMSYFPSSKELYVIYSCIANNTWKSVVVEQQCTLK